MRASVSKNAQIVQNDFLIGKWLIDWFSADWQWNRGQIASADSAYGGLFGQEVWFQALLIIKIIIQGDSQRFYQNWAKGIF